MAFPPTFSHDFEEGSIVFECPTEICYKRAKWLLIKEPGTISWIDSFERGAVFWDIGANIGVFSLYACVRRACPVLAFEPGAANYFTLNNNIRLNHLDSRISAVPVALADRSRFDTMRMRDAEIGSSLHVFGRDTDFKGETFAAAWQQGALGVSMDALVGTFGLPVPAHVKIDVDGNELEVLRGGRDTLANPAVESVLVEVDLNDAPEVDAVSSLLGSAGLERADIHGNVSRNVQGAQIFNMIYRRHA